MLAVLAKNGLPVSWLSVALLFAALGGCTSAYYNFWETFGLEKRDLLHDGVVSAKDMQKDLQNDFKDTLERIRHEYKFDGGKLERTYEQISADYERAERKTKSLKERIARVKDIAADLFDEWQREAHSLQSPSLRRDSLAKLSASKKRFATLLASMHGVEKSLDQVLARMRDQRLYLKHNLNAKALDAFKGEYAQIETEIRSLVAEMNHSIAAADSFSASLTSETPPK